MVGAAYDSVDSECPLLEDEVMVAVYKDYLAMHSFIKYIANDYFELSHEKVRIQRDDYVRMARELLKELDR